MGIKYSTGRGTRLKHSTAMEWEDLEKVKKKYDPIKHSTGEESTIRHATGTEFDYKVLSKRMQSAWGLQSKPQIESDGSDEYLRRFHEHKAARRASDKLEEGKGSETTKQE